MRTTFILIALIIGLRAQAQQYTDENQPPNDEVKSLFNRDNDITGFGNVDFRLSKIKDKQTLVMGAYGGILINRSVMFGLAGYGFTSEVDFDGTLPGTSTTDQLNLHGGYGGLVLGMMVASKEVVHLSFPVILAAGNMEISDNDFFNIPGSDRSYVVESSKFFVIEPSAQVELNISKTFRMALGGGYRFIRALELENVTDSEMSGFTGVLSFKFGGF